VPPVNDLRLSIHQTYAAIGIDAEPAKQQIRSPRGIQEIRGPSAEMNFESVPSELRVDSSEAWHALAKGPNLEWSSSIYSRMKSVFLQHLAQMVDEGKRMADITNPRSAFADLAKDALFRSNLVSYRPAEPSYDNVYVTFTPGHVSIAIEASRPEIRYMPQKPEISAEWGKLEIYLRHKNTIEIEVTTYDLYK
jgi:hypothetical protein